MAVTAIHLELRAHGAPDLVLRQHALDREFDDQVRASLHARLELLRLHAARHARIVVIELLVRLLASDLHLLGVDDDHVVAGINKWGVLGAFLAGQNARCAAGEPSQRLVSGVNHEPLTLDVPFFWKIRRHIDLNSTPGYLRMHFANRTRTIQGRATIAAAYTARQMRMFRPLLRFRENVSPIQCATETEAPQPIQAAQEELHRT